MSYKVCVYAICKNELQFVQKWLDNMSEADYIVILDTGSTDGTFEALQADPRVTLVQQAIIDPWRFDVARNRSMELVPEDADILVCTDFDELFEPGWAQVLRDN
jgi:glycosyltransferase involved in cell wall biosynthesis